jgi:hypothetical protein
VTQTNAINATLYEKLDFNFIRDIAPVAGLVPPWVNPGPGSLVPPPALPARCRAEETTNWFDAFKDLTPLMVKSKRRGACFDLKDGRLFIRHRRKLPKQLSIQIEANRARIVWLFERMPDMALEYSSHFAKLRSGYDNVTESNEPIH